MDTGVENTRELPKEIDIGTDTRDILARATQYAADRNFRDWLIVDVDAHHSEMASWKEVVTHIEDPVLRETAIQLQKRTGSTAGLSNHVGGLRYQDVGGRIPHQTALRETVDDDSVHRDVTLMRRVMDALSIDWQVLFPGNLLQLGLHPQPRVEVQLSFAYNRFLMERIIPAEPRLKTLLYLPFCEPKECERMVEEFAGHPDVIGFMVTSVRYKSVHHDSYMRLYSMIEETGKPLCFHAGNNWQDDYLKQLDTFISMHAISFVLCNMVHLANWVMHGLNERFPKLDVIWTESGVAWVPFMMQRLDNEYLMRSSEAPNLKRLPSEYIQEMYFTTQPMERTNMDLLAAGFKAMKADTQLLYASDWPHWDFDAPNSVYELPFLTEDAKKNILGRNAARLFGLPDSP
ncbi:MAG: amidohydrolase family protein [Pseudomonadota bacterium]|nr:amidohydrolase family protein [Pseudomonadota bacterium]